LESRGREKYHDREDKIEVAADMNQNRFGEEIIQ
jgi:hypothetical protein